MDSWPVNHAFWGLWLVSSMWCIFPVLLQISHSALGNLFVVQCSVQIAGSESLWIIRLVAHSYCGSMTDRSRSFLTAVSVWTVTSGGPDTALSQVSGPLRFTRIDEPCGVKSNLITHLAAEVWIKCPTRIRWWSAPQESFRTHIMCKRKY